MCVCVHVCVYSYARVCAVCVYVHMCVCTHVCVHVCVLCAVCVYVHCVRAAIQRP